MSDPFALVEALQIENAALRQQVAQLTDQQSVRHLLDTQHTSATARKRAEEALRESELLYESLVEVSPLCICRKDLAGRFTFANRRFLEESHITLADLVGKTDFDLHPPELAEKYRRDEKSVMDSGQVWELIEERTLLDGESIVVQSIKTPIYDGTGKINGTQTSFWDITERKRAEEALRESEARAQAMLHAIPDLMFRMNRQGVFLDYKADISDLYAQAEPTILGKRNRDLTPPEFADLIDRQIVATLETGALQTFEYQLPMPDRGLRSYEARMVVSGPDEVTAIVRDVTERQRTEEALRESELLYESLVEVSPLSICRKDLAGRFTFANRRFLEESNITLADLVGKTDFDLHPPELAEKYRRDDRAVIDSGQVWELIEERSIMGDESIVVQSIKTPIYDGSGNITGVQISFWDITARQRAEKALRELNVTLEQRVAERTRELAEANLHLAELSRLKDEFITRISHELRTPLANVKLYLQLLEQGQPEKRATYFQTLHQQMERLHHLIEDLLDVSHLTLDTIEVRPAPLDVAALLHSLITDQAARALARGLTLTAVPAPDRPTLTTDPNLLRQALSNVLTNALNYTPRGGAITLRTDRSSTPEGEWVTIEVRDTGAGISAQDLPHIFEPFYRGAAAADYKTPGTGVGLSIAQRLIERLGGRITVESNPGRGAAFTFWLRA